MTLKEYVKIPKRLLDRLLWLDMNNEEVLEQIEIRKHFPN